LRYVFLLLAATNVRVVFGFNVTATVVDVALGNASQFSYLCG
jgi:hypothetical protein